MSKYHCQYQYVAKEELKKDSQPSYKRSERNNFQRKSNKYPRRNYSGDKRHQTEPDSKPHISAASPQIFCLEPLVLLGYFKEKAEPIPEIADLMKKIPTLFSAKPQKPVGFSNNQSDEEEPEWMQETEFKGTFEMKDIENDLASKRIEYQKAHGTYEKKQEQLRQKEELLLKHQESSQLLEQEKQKYREQILADEKRLEEESLKKNQQIETQAKLQQLFNLKTENNKQLNNFLTVEEIERKLDGKNGDPAPTCSPMVNLNDLEEILDIINTGGNCEPKQSLVTQAKIDKQPFALQASIHQKAAMDLKWYYIDNSMKVQGPFPSTDMDAWNAQKYFKPDLMISWGEAGRWIFLQTFMENLKKIKDGTLPEMNAMEPTPQQRGQVELHIERLKKKLTDQKLQAQAQAEYIQQQQQYQNQFIYYQKHLNKKHGSAHSANYQQFTQQYQYQNNQPYQYQTQNQNNYQHYNNVSSNNKAYNNNKHQRTIFNIGEKKGDTYLNNLTNNDSHGVQFDPKEFPSIDDRK